LVIFTSALRITPILLVRSFSCGECHRRKQKVSPYSFQSICMA
jgi:hypothetical protein